MKNLIMKLILAIDEAVLAALICTKFMGGKKAPGMLLLAAMILLTDWVMEKNVLRLRDVRVQACPHRLCRTSVRQRPLAG